MSDWRELLAEVDELEPPEDLSRRIGSGEAAEAYRFRRWPRTRRAVGLVGAAVGIVLLLVALAVAAHGRRDGSPAPATPPEPSTRLTLTYEAITVVEGAIVPEVRERFTLTCGPAGGDLPDPAEACRRIIADPDRFFGSSRLSCLGGFFRWSLTVAGVFEGRPVDRRLDMCDYPQARAWTDLGGTTFRGVVGSGNGRVAERQRRD